MQTSGRRADEHRAQDTPYYRLLRYSPRRHIRNMNPSLRRLNAGAVIYAQRSKWGMDWSN